MIRSPMTLTSRPTSANVLIVLATGAAKMESRSASPAAALSGFAGGDDDLESRLGFVAEHGSRDRPAKEGP